MALGDQLSSIIGMRQYLHTRTIHARVHVHTAGSLYILTHIRKHQYQDSNQVDAWREQQTSQQPFYCAHCGNCIAWDGGKC